MSGKINCTKAGLVFGAVLGLFHLSWAALVAMGWAQPVIDFVLWLHFIKPFLVLESFSIGRAVGLVALTAAVGFVFGWVFAFLWNRAHGS